MSGPVHVRSLQRIERIAGAPLDSRALRIALLEEIGKVVPFDAYAWLLTDPATSVGSSPLADCPCLPELPRLIRLKYLTEVNRWTGLAAVGVARLADVTAGDLSKSLVWRELLHRYGITDIASLVFRDAYGCWGWLDLWRGPTAPRFDAGEAAYLAGVRAPVTGALRASQARTFGESPRSTQSARGGPAVLVLSADLEVLGQTAETETYLHSLVPPDSGRSPVPAGAYNVGAQLIAVEAGVDPNPPQARVYLANGRWLTLRAARIGSAGLAEERDIAVTIEDCSARERADLFARSNGLSPRESELLSHLIRGADTRELASAMYLSEHTVQDHLKSIFAKTGVHNRRTLLVRALG